MKSKEHVIFISQKENFAGNHGLVIRSSAIFYYKYSHNFKSTISFMNYWYIKRDLNVMIIASTRDMKGKLVLREAVNFDQGNVINYEPQIRNKENTDYFEGSVEIEVFSNTNMVIPYAAIMAVYTMTNSISMVHSYGRTYSPHEVEEARTISIGHESCWTIRDSQEVKSFCVFHNGYSICEQQTVRMELTNSTGEKKQIILVLPQLAPFQTYKLYPADHYPEIIAFLNNQAGNASLSYILSNAFTRLLVGNESANEMQVTHSNFNYAIHQTDCVEDGTYAYMNIVNTDFNDTQVIVYPDCHKGQYSMLIDEKVYDFDGSKRLQIDIEKNAIVKFKRHDGPLPMRIVTAYSGKQSKDITLPFECSLGIHHDNYPAKHSHWGLVAWSEKCRSQVIVQLQTELFGEIGNSETALIHLHSAHMHNTLQKTLNYHDIQALREGLYLDHLFPQCDSFLGGDFGYIYLTSSYPGFSCFTTIENNTGSMTFEHTF